MHINSEFCKRQPIGVKNLSAALTRLRLECTHSTDFRSDLAVLNDLTVTTYKWCVENKLLTVLVSLSHALMVPVVNYMRYDQTNNTIVTALGTSTSIFTVHSLATYSEKITGGMNGG